MSESRFARGSEWRKWDLHLHSPASYLNNQFRGNEGEDVWESYVKAIEQTGLSVIAVTDYFSVDGYRKLRDYKEKGRLSQIDLILPNVELRLSILDREGKRVNVHVIFSDKVCVDDIEDHFLHELHFTREGRPQSTDIDQKIKKQNLEELGQEYIAQNAGKKLGRNALETGATLAVVDHSEITRLLQHRFKDQYALVLADDKLPRWNTSGHEIRKVLTQKADFIFTSFPNDIEWYLGKHEDYDTPEQFKKEFKSLKPCIHGSDAHELFFIGHPCTKRGQKGHNCKVSKENCELRYCWIKADPTFEGLRQVLYEPEDRVQLQADDPTPSRYIHSLSHVHFSKDQINKELTVLETNIPLHYGLIAVAGGKGAGKTAFVDLIANCFDNRQDKQGDNSFVWRICKNDSPTLNVALQFAGGQEFEKTVTDTSSTIVEADFAYISQGQLDEFITVTEELTRNIENLLFASVSEAQAYQLSAIVERIEQTVESIQQESSKILQLEKRTGPEAEERLGVQKKQIQARLEDLERQISEVVNAVQDADSIRRAEEAQKNLAELRSKLAGLKDLKRQVNVAVKFLDEELPGLNQALDAINDLILALSLDYEGLDKIIFLRRDRLTTISEDVEQHIESVLNEIDATVEKLGELENQSERHAKLLDEKDEEEKSFQRIEEDHQEFLQLVNELGLARTRRANLYVAMLQSIGEKRDSYQAIIERFRSDPKLAISGDRQRVLSDLTFRAHIEFDSDDFHTQASDLFNNQRVRVRGENSQFADTLRRFADFANGVEGSADRLADTLESHVNDSKLRSKIKTNQSINDDDFFRVFYRQYFTVNPVVKYKGIGIESLSLGQKATVLIKVYLAHGSYPIIVDSHDDHLDNQFIMDELIPAIREAKKDRQVILVSNNANVVVNSDAEQIIIAEHQEGTISYVSGSLENASIRAKALRVLEGGEEAFRKRQQKYRMD